MDIISLKSSLYSQKDEVQAAILSRFFKTEKGDYGEGDQFLGIRVPVIRKIVKDYHFLSFDNIQELLNDSIHEIRFAALVVLIQKFNQSDSINQEKIFHFYLKNIRNHINNWDLVDLSCPQIVGKFLWDKNRSCLYSLSESDSLWEKRVSIISTLYFIRNGDYADTLKISKLLLNDKHDLIHKAIGWMLREVGKKDINIERKFLEEYSQDMPRTALRYAIEKMDEKERKYFLNR